MSEFVTTTADDRDDDGEVLAAQREQDDAVFEECEPEFVDGRYYGCGACEPCKDQTDSDEDS